MQALFGPLPLLNKVQHRNKVYQTVLPIPDISTTKPEYSVVRVSLSSRKLSPPRTSGQITSIRQYPLGIRKDIFQSPGPRLILIERQSNTRIPDPILDNPTISPRYTAVEAEP